MTDNALCFCFRSIFPLPIKFFPPVEERDSIEQVFSIMTSNNRQTTPTASANRSAAANGQAARTCQFKMVLLGESAVGKSSLVLRFVKGQFHEYQESTIGAAFLTQTVSVDDVTVKLELWDTAGQERSALLVVLLLGIHCFSLSLSRG